MEDISEKDLEILKKKAAIHDKMSEIAHLQNLMNAKHSEAQKLEAELAELLTPTKQ